MRKSVIKVIAGLFIGMVVVTGVKVDAKAADLGLPADFNIPSLEIPSGVVPLDFNLSLPNVYMPGIDTNQFMTLNNQMINMNVINMTNTNMASMPNLNIMLSGAPISPYMSAQLPMIMQPVGMYGQMDVIQYALLRHKLAFLEKTGLLFTY